MRSFAKSVSLFSLFSVLVPAVSFAVTCNSIQGEIKGGIKECKQARANDLAEIYVLDRNGNLFRFVKGNKCQVTNDVDSIKVSEHPNDKAVAYFKKGGNLFVLHNADLYQAITKDCPSTSKKMIMNNVKKYTVVSNTNTTIVNMALDKMGNFRAWENNMEVTPYWIRSLNIDDYVNNTCYGSAGKSFNSYVAFLITARGSVAKLKGKDVQNSKMDQDTGSFYSLRDFKDRKNVCQ